MSPPWLNPIQARTLRIDFGNPQQLLEASESIVGQEFESGGMPVALRVPRTTLVRVKNCDPSLHQCLRVGLSPGVSAIATSRSMHDDGTREGFLPRGQKQRCDKRVSVAEVAQLGGLDRHSSPARSGARGQGQEQEGERAEAGTWAAHGQFWTPIGKSRAKHSPLNWTHQGRQRFMGAPAGTPRTD